MFFPVEQLASSSAFVVLQYERNSTNLMSNVKRNQAGTFYIAGAEWYYERSLSNKDRLYTAGPIHRPINVLADINGRNPGFRIIFHSSKETENESDIYEWVKVPEPCSVSCGGGVQQGIVLKIFLKFFKNIFGYLDNLMLTFVN